jgi:hypothetical protein
MAPPSARDALRTFAFGIPVAGELQTRGPGRVRDGTSMVTVGMLRVTDFSQDIQPVRP